MGAFTDAGDKIIAGAVQGMASVAVKIMLDSVNNECPIQTGTLRASAKIEPPEARGDRVVVRMGYGYGYTINPETREPASEYAVPVHEKTEAKHKPPTKAKFLEDPVLAWSGTLGPTMAGTIKMLLLDKRRVKMVKIGTINGTTVDYIDVAAPYAGIPNV